jgi:hypothetical protein
MEEVPMKRNDKGTTADLALQWTFREERTPSMLRYRDWIKRASRFVVDNDMVDAMVKHSTDINKLDGRFWLARLPHEVTWIEWDQKHHVMAQATHSRMRVRETNLSDVPHRTGLLLVRDPIRETRFTVYHFSEIDERATDVLTGKRLGAEDRNNMLSPVCYVIDSEEMISSGYTCFGVRTLQSVFVGDVDTTSAPAVVHKLVDDIETWSRVLPLGLMHINHTTHTMEPGQAEEDNFKQMGFYGKLMTGLVSDHTDKFIGVKKILAKSGQSPEAMRKVDRLMNALTAILKEEAGMMRQMVTLLAMINSVPTIIKKVEPSGYRPIGMNKVRYLSHSTITLALPKTRPALFIERSMRNALGDYTKRRAHPVRTYWREKRDSGNRYCPHSFDNIEKNKYECSHCGRVGWWIKEHVRGDASKGWVRQDYRVVAA